MEGSHNKNEEKELKILLLTVIEFFCGSLMFSFWIGKLLHTDIRRIWDGNPGATNLWRATNYKWGFLGLFLDYLKGFVPLIFIIDSGIIKGFEIVPVAVAPIFGHAFSPFLKGKGGKTIDISFGVWSALTKWEGPVILGVSFTLFSLFRRKTSPEDDALRAILGMLVLFVYIIIRGFPLYMITIWLVNFLVILLKHKKEISHLLIKNRILTKNA